MEFSQKEIQAIMDVILHWEADIRAPLSRNLRVSVGWRGKLMWPNGRSVKCYASKSALCILCVTETGDVDCKKCPYFRHYGKSCNMPTSKWGAFIRSPSVETCDRMIASLRSLLLYAENSMREVHTTGEGIKSALLIRLRSWIVCVGIN